MKTATSNINNKKRRGLPPNGTASSVSDKQQHFSTSGTAVRPMPMPQTTRLILLAIASYAVAFLTDHFLIRDGSETATGSSGAVSFIYSWTGSRVPIHVVVPLNFGALAFLMHGYALNSSTYVEAVIWSAIGGLFIGYPLAEALSSVFVLASMMSMCNVKLPVTLAAAVVHTIGVFPSFVDAAKASAEVEPFVTRPLFWVLCSRLSLGVCVALLLRTSRFSINARQTVKREIAQVSSRFDRLVERSAPVRILSWPFRMACSQMATKWFTGLLLWVATMYIEWTTKISVGGLLLITLLALGICHTVISNDGGKGTRSFKAQLVFVSLTVIVNGIVFLLAPLKMLPFIANSVLTAFIILFFIGPGPAFELAEQSSLAQIDKFSVDVPLQPPLSTTNTVFLVSFWFMTVSFDFVQQRSSGWEEPSTSRAVVACNAIGFGILTMGSSLVDAINTEITPARQVLLGLCKVEQQVAEQVLLKQQHEDDARKQVDVPAHKEDGAAPSGDDEESSPHEPATTLHNGSRRGSQDSSTSHPDVEEGDENPLSSSIPTQSATPDEEPSTQLSPQMEEDDTNPLCAVAGKSSIQDAADVPGLGAPQRSSDTDAGDAVQSASGSFAASASKSSVELPAAASTVTLSTAANKTTRKKEKALEKQRKEEERRAEQAAKEQERLRREFEEAQKLESERKERERRTKEEAQRRVEKEKEMKRRHEEEVAQKLKLAAEKKEAEQKRALELEKEKKEVAERKKKEAAGAAAAKEVAKQPAAVAVPTEIKLSKKDLPVPASVAKKQAAEKAAAAAAAAAANAQKKVRPPSPVSKSPQGALSPAPELGKGKSKTTATKNAWKETPPASVNANAAGTRSSTIIVKGDKSGKKSAVMGGGSNAMQVKPIDSDSEDDTLQTVNDAIAPRGATSSREHTSMSLAVDSPRRDSGQNSSTIQQPASPMRDIDDLLTNLKLTMGIQNTVSTTAAPQLDLGGSVLEQEVGNSNGLDLQSMHLALVGDSTGSAPPRPQFGVKTPSAQSDSSGPASAGPNTINLADLQQRLTSGGAHQLPGTSASSEAEGQVTSANNGTQGGDAWDHGFDFINNIVSGDEERPSPTQHSSQQHSMTNSPQSLHRTPGPAVPGLQNVQLPAGVVSPMSMQQQHSPQSASSISPTANGAQPHMVVQQQAGMQQMAMQPAMYAMQMNGQMVLVPAQQQYQFVPMTPQQQHQLYLQQQQLMYQQQRQQRQQSQ